MPLTPAERDTLDAIERLLRNDMDADDGVGHRRRLGEWEQPTSIPEPPTPHWGATTAVTAPPRRWTPTAVYAAAVVAAALLWHRSRR